MGKAKTYLDVVRKLYTEISKAYQGFQWASEQPPLAIFLPQGDVNAILRDLGVDANLAHWSEGCGPYGNYTWGNDSRWLIDILDGPIRQLSIHHQFHVKVVSYDRDERESSLTIEFLVPDPRMGQVSSPVSASSFRLTPDGVRWEERKGKSPQGGFVVEVISRLSKDRSITRALAPGWDIDQRIVADPVRASWIITKKREHAHEKEHPDPEEIRELLGPTKQQWDCYQAIGRCLLEIPIATEE